MEPEQLQTGGICPSDNLLTGKEFIRVKFQAAAGNTAGKVYGVRIVRNK